MLGMGNMRLDYKRGAEGNVPSDRRKRRPAGFTAPSGKDGGNAGKKPEKRSITGCRGFITVF